MPKTNQNSEKKICAAALRLTASHGWSPLTLEHIAKTAKIPVAQVKKLCADKNALLSLLVRYIDDNVKAAVGKPDMRATSHDRLFEVMMARLDILQTHRKTILDIIAETKRDPSLARILLPAQHQAMQNMLALAGLKEEGIKQFFATTGLLTIYVGVLCQWERDETKDMSKTMATLDRYLRRAEKAAEIFFRAF